MVNPYMNVENHRSGGELHFVEGCGLGVGRVWVECGVVMEWVKQKTENRNG